MKTLPITKQTAQALSNGADTILVPIDFEKVKCYELRDEDLIENHVPIQVGDKFQAVWVDTTFTYNGFFGTKTIYEHEAVSIEIIRTTKIEHEDAVSISQGDGADFMSWVDEQHGDGFYSSNRYVALIKTKELTDEAIHIN